MAKFIHLSLLLAVTTQLPVVSATKISIAKGKKVTFKFPPSSTVEYCCRDNRCKFAGQDFEKPKVRVTKNELTIHGFDNDINQLYSCYGDSHPQPPPVHTDLLLCLNITGCQNPGSSNCVVEFSDLLPFTEADWVKLCPGKSGNNNKCHQCKKDVKIQLKRHPVSGDCLSNSDSGNGDEHAAGLRFYKASKSWIDALEHCQNQNSSLAEIHNQTVQASVNSSLLNENSMLSGAWIGLERSIFGKNNPWKWISGTQVGNHCPWNESYPVDALNHHCGKIIWVAELEQFKWLDACCHEELPFICQTPT